MCGGLLIMEQKEKYMKIALKEAKKAELLDEVPIGCIIVKEGKIIARAHNTREKDKLVTSHCEINAIKKASKKIKDWQLVDCELYVTLEPCIMCSGAIYQSRIKKVYFGAYDLKQGGVTSLVKTFDLEKINHHPEYEGGILEEECRITLQNYFKKKRQTKV